MDSMILGCVFRNGVICSEHDRCEKCGWNPVVEKERIEKFREWYAQREAEKEAADGVDGS